MQWMLLALLAVPQIDRTINRESISGPTGLAPLNYPWRFQPGDDPSWALPEFDDSSWIRSLPYLEIAQEFPTGWKGIGWFRTTVDVGPELAGVPLALWPRHYGAMELYVDGKLLLAKGRIENSAAVQPEPLDVDPRAPTIVTFDRGGPHLIAVRFASDRTVYYDGFFRGIEISIGDHQRSIDYNVNYRTEYHGVHEFFIGAALVLAILHLLIYLFTRRYPENLSFALATFSVAGIAIFSRMWSFCETVVESLVPTTLFKVSLLCTVFFSITFYYRVFLDRMPAFARIASGVAGLLIVSAYFLPMRLVFLIASLAFLEPARILVLALLRKKEDAWIVCVGGVASIAAALVQMVPMIFGDDDPAPPKPIYLYGFLVLLLSMSIYLARRFARMNQSLREQLVQVQELSELTLAQERENAKKQTELEEAKKREAVLAELQIAHSDLKRTQAKLVQSEKMASLGQLVAGVAHEINTPVGAIHSMRDSLAKAVEKMRVDLEKNHPQILEEGVVKRALKVLQDGLHVIETGSERVTGIVKRLKTFARLDEAELQLADIHAGIEDTLVLLAHELKKGVEVEKSFGTIPKINCYPGQLNQVFLNVLVNAVQAIDGKGKITIETRSEDSQVVVKIADDGSGIPPEALPRIFDPGFTTKGVGVGTGLGLSIVYGIIQDHAGDISVESEVGRGTAFTIRLPIALARH
jgi:signal transduction histidine kinase